MGILSVVFSGYDDTPKWIDKAEVEGLGPNVRRAMNGTKIGDYTNHSGNKKKVGINLIARTGPTMDSRTDAFRISQSTQDRIKASGTALHNAYPDRVYFAVGKSANGGMGYYDQDRSWKCDSTTGANAGRWFVQNVKTSHQIIRELDDLKLPNVGA